jgi:large conductance mechanosensitive channel
MRQNGDISMKAFMLEFKEFINKGNLLGIAVGFVMGIAFAAVITALVDNIIMPIVAIPFGKPNFDSALILTINDAEIRFGAFITALVTFIAIAFTVFVLLKAYNKATKGEATAPPNEIVLLGGILSEMQALRSDMSAGGDPNR